MREIGTSISPCPVYTPFEIQAGALTTALSGLQTATDTGDSTKVLPVVLPTEVISFPPRNNPSLQRRLSENFDAFAG